MSKQWNCAYIAKTHKWIVDEDQSNTGEIGVKVHCENCDQVDCLPAPYAKNYLAESRKVVAEVLSHE